MKDRNSKKLAESIENALNDKGKGSGSGSGSGT